MRTPHLLLLTAMIFSSAPLQARDLSPGEKTRIEAGLFLETLQSRLQDVNSVIADLSRDLGAKRRKSNEEVATYQKVLCHYEGELQGIYLGGNEGLRAIENLADTDAKRALALAKAALRHVPEWYDMLKDSCLVPNSDPVEKLIERALQVSEKTQPAIVELGSQAAKLKLLR
ncbi:MAG TPA: hypothetical protein VIH99_03135 [Bdellovibrionota bacterium]|jgi:hypothetical protein